MANYKKLNLFLDFFWNQNESMLNLEVIVCFEKSDNLLKYSHLEMLWGSVKSDVPKILIKWNGYRIELEI